MTTIAVASPPVARADDASFVDAVHALGFPQSAPNLVSTAESACYFLRRGRDPQQVLERILRYTRVEPDQARQFFVLATTEYCPQYSDLARHSQVYKPISAR
ncbi:MAG: DUF732 domain-containing protein [Mycobacterium kyogaense]|uniref:DUF732 domain-containing protein n=1 Tax=Mycobacterium kyogaense TaxID=2212479 RepID=UPI002FFB1E40